MFSHLTGSLVTSVDCVIRLLLIPPTGAAFTEGLSSGLSTSVAVFCHELPHELGENVQTENLRVLPRSSDKTRVKG